MEEYTVKYTQENGICGDNITVFLRVNKQGVIEAYSFAGYPQMFTKAAASMLAEIIEGKGVETVLSRNYQTMSDLGLEVSPRRKRSIVSGLLAAKNALHLRKNDGIVETYEDLLQGV